MSDPETRIAEFMSRPGMAEAVAAKRAKLDQADRGEVSRLLDRLERIKAAVRLLYPEEMTPYAKRLFDSILMEVDDGDS